MKTSPAKNRLPLLLGLAVSCFMSGNAGAQLSIAEQPLVVFQNVKSNLIVTLDDSGSMSFETITPTNDGSLYWQRDNTDSFVDVDGTLFFGTAGRKYSYVFPYTEGPNGGHHVIPPFPQFGFIRSSAYNAGYYDPTETYAPWPDVDAVAAPAKTARVFGDIDPTAAPSDPSGSTGNDDRLHNLTADFEFTNEGFHFQQDMIIPDGTRLRNNGNNAWETQVGDAPWTGANNAERGIDYYPAFYYTPVTTGSYTITIPGDLTAIPPVLPQLVTGTCATPIQVNYRVFERLPSALTGDADALGPDGTCLVRTDIAPGTPEMQNFANWFSYYRKRHLSVRNGIVGAFADLQLGMNVGFFTINNRVNVNMREFDNNPSVDERDIFLHEIYETNFGGGTPNRDALNHSGSQFERSGANRIIEFECQKNFNVMFTDGFSQTNGPNVGNVDGGEGVPYADGFGSTIADIAMEYYENLDTSGLAFAPENQGEVSIPRECSTATLPTPLDCKTDLHVNTYMVVLNGTGNLFNVTYNEVEEAYVTPPTWPNTNGNRDPSQIDDLYHAAVNGRGLMLNASSPAEIADRFQVALADIVARSRPTTALTATSTRLTTDSRLYQAAFDSFDWSGDLLAIDLDGNIDWSGNDLLEARSTARSIFTSNDAGGVAFGSFSDLSAANQTALTNNILVETGADITIATPPFTGDQFLAFIAGDDALEGAPLRDRENILGDIVSSEPIVSASGNEGWGRLDLSSGGPSYSAYLGGTKASRPDVVYVGANDGMLHAFDAENGAELFAYVPKATTPKLAQLGNPGYLHTFFVDATPTAADAYNGSWKTVLVGGLGAGGRGVYALDVTNPGSFNSADVLWELTSDDDPDLGFTIGRPLVTRTSNGTWVAIFGNGYNSQNNEGFLFVVDLFNGTVLAKIATEEGTPADPAGLASPRLEMNGIDGLSLANVYAGDLNGNMWKFDLSASSPGSWASAFTSGGDPSPLFTAIDRAGNSQAITAAPTLARTPKGDLAVAFGTGKFFEDSDATVSANPVLQSFYVVVEDRPDLDPTSAFNIANPITRGDLTDIRFNGETAGGARRFDLATVPSQLGQGWFLDLALNVNSPTGERVVATPRVGFGAVIFTTFEPTNTPCSPGGIPRLYILDTNGKPRPPFLGECTTDCDATGAPLTTGAPVVPPVVIDSVRSPEDCVTNPTGPGCYCVLNPTDASCASESISDSFLSGCPIGSRPVVVIDPETRVRTPIGCIKEGRNVWGETQAY